MKNLHITIFACFVLVSLGAIGQTTINLNNGWKFKHTGNSKWNIATVPGTVHTDLLSNKLIPDPFYRDNETKVQWISKVDWEYKIIFNVASDLLYQQQIELVFEGLDTYANVYLNDSLISKADNMFRTWRIDVKSFLKQKQNELYIRFLSADRIVDSMAKAAFPKVLPSENNRQYARKAQYHFGWDWAPKLTTCGIWRNVKLEAGNRDEIQMSKLKMQKRNEVNLVQVKDSIGQSFYFTVNGKPTFIKGANWVPADVFLPRITKQKYRNLLIAAKEANINMLRVWGGGIYEDDYFYKLCDSLNIMVWQDFMFAGAMYPADEHFLENIKHEAIDNIIRLRKYRCIVLWCGNNEIDEAWNNWGWQKQFKLTGEDSSSLWNDCKKIFHELLPGLLKELDGDRPYIASSPLHGWGRKQSMTEGDSHYWGVWWGQEPIEKYNEKIPRFMSEYGMQAMPNFETMKQFSLPLDWDTASLVMKVHQKHPTGYKTLATYLHQNKLQPKNFVELITATQEVQSRAMETAITAHMKAAPVCMGTMFWQFNDCWPVTSWSVIDYYGRKKRAYYTVKDLYKQAVKNIRQ